jgi:hypothetical protein
MPADKPHKAIIQLHLTVYDVLDSGEVSGKPIPQSDLKQYELGRTASIIISGPDKHHCLMKVKSIMEKLNAGA